MSLSDPGPDQQRSEREHLLEPQIRHPQVYAGVKATPLHEPLLAGTGMSISTI